MIFKGTVFSPKTSNFFPDSNFTVTMPQKTFPNVIKKLLKETYSVFAFTLENMISTSVEVTFLSNNFRSLHNLANFDPSMSAAASFPPPNEQNDLNTASIINSLHLSQSLKCHIQKYRKVILDFD